MTLNIEGGRRRRRRQERAVSVDVDPEHLEKRK